MKHLLKATDPAVFYAIAAVLFVVLIFVLATIFPEYAASIIGVPFLVVLFVCGVAAGH